MWWDCQTTSSRWIVSLILTVCATLTFPFASSGSTFGEKFSYDPAGNRLSGPGTIDTGFTSNKGNQLTKGRLYSYLYDGLGNQTNRVIAAAPEKTWTHE